MLFAPFQARQIHHRWSLVSGRCRRASVMVDAPWASREMLGAMKVTGS